MRRRILGLTRLRARARRCAAGYPWEFGVTRAAEQWNGRLAMLGIAALAVSQVPPARPPRQTDNAAAAPPLFPLKARGALGRRRRRA